MLQSSSEIFEEKERERERERETLRGNGDSVSCCLLSLSLSLSLLSLSSAFSLSKLLLSKSQVSLTTLRKERTKNGSGYSKFDRGHQVISIRGLGSLGRAHSRRGGRAECGSAAQRWRVIVSSSVVGPLVFAIRAL